MGMAILRTRPIVKAEAQRRRVEIGAVIQAGDRPQLGDVNHGLVLDDYRRVAEVLNPVRFEAYRRGLFVLPAPYDQIDETLAWIRRFD
ncbi:DUF3396 domain-containing protein [Rhizobium sp. XQZ8]|uniref:type VI immunity family protein n=1 Tax=Rhizobium populisoli TaxID=2859785 RepID=UPI001C666943|nr:type VI immunity family protein [Rhizobium populisoli]MBW6426153.1 DUF3396 domain-containing protein [Rhizobium populisoli]